MAEADAKLKIDREMSPLEYHMLRRLGLNRDEMQIVHDLSVHAAEKAAENIFMIAMTSPRIDMINLISVTAALLLGQSGKSVANLNAEQLADIMKGKVPEGLDLRSYDGFATR